MTVFSVDSDAVLTSASSISTTIERVRSEFALMHTQIQQLQGAWSGGASSAFHAAVDQWRAAQLQVEEALSSVSSALSTAGRQYADAENANLSLFR